MVSSRIIKSLIYPEKNNCNEEDIGLNVSSFEIELYHQDVSVAIGKENFNYYDKGIIIFPLYLLKNFEIVSQIGLFEINKQKYDNGIIDEDNDVDIGKIGQPLLFENSEKIIENIHKILQPKKTILLKFKNGEIIDHIEDAKIKRNKKKNNIKTKR